jgi:CRISPR-associated endonuclease/helicase Cas3
LPDTIPHFEALTGFKPYPWQERCFRQLMAGVIPKEITLPTGAGKTSFVILYLIALSLGAALPRRLAYIVDRRAIVDQTAEQVSQWIQSIEDIHALVSPLRRLAAFRHPESRAVEVGILRGGIADSGEWRLDPAKPAVLIGTVDIIGSRLLFSGYGDGRSRRALHAGLLGVDTTVILDESHLSTAFAATLREIERLNASSSTPAFRTVTMSATPRESEGSSLHEDDARHPGLGQRVQADKRPHLHLVKTAADRRRKIAELAVSHERGAILIFMRSAQDAQLMHAELVRKLGGDGKDRVGLLTGTLRGAERESLTHTELWRRFAEPRKDDFANESVYLVSTAAGEVGIDLDADHVVMDLVPLDSLIQRLGRVNRRGRFGESRVDIVHIDADSANDPKKQDWKHRYAWACERTLSVVRECESLSPIQLLGLPLDTLAECATPVARPAPPDKDRITLLAATSARLNLPPVDVHLRGVLDQPEYTETQLLWRHDVSWLLDQGVDAARDALSMHPPRSREVLKLPAIAAARELAKLAKATGGFECIRIGTDGTVNKLAVTREQLSPRNELAFVTLVLPAHIGGLSEAGFLDARWAGRAVNDLADDDECARFLEDPDDDSCDDRPPWIKSATVWRVPLETNIKGEITRWLTYARRRPGELALDSDSDLSRLARSVHSLSEHSRAVADAARRIGEALDLDADLMDALETAGGHHDDGKANRVWQRAAGNTGGEPIAKSRRGHFRPALLGGYRHEFGSLARTDRELSTNKGTSHRDLVLHLIAAHHGHCRPGFPDPRQWDPELPHEVCRALSLDCEERFVALQDAYGVWGLAWLEGLVKCADAWASSGYEAMERRHEE